MSWFRWERVPAPNESPQRQHQAGQSGAAQRGINDRVDVGVPEERCILVFARRQTPLLMRQLHARGQHPEHELTQRQASAVMPLGERRSIHESTAALAPWTRALLYGEEQHVANQG